MRRRTTRWMHAMRPRTTTTALRQHTTRATRSRARRSVERGRRRAAGCSRSAGTRTSRSNAPSASAASVASAARMMLASAWTAATGGFRTSQSSANPRKEASPISRPPSRRRPTRARGRSDDGPLRAARTSGSSHRHRLRRRRLERHEDQVHPYQERVGRGYHDLELSCLNGPIKECTERADGSTDPNGLSG